MNNIKLSLLSSAVIFTLLLFRRLYFDGVGFYLFIGLIINILLYVFSFKIKRSSDKINIYKILVYNILILINLVSIYYDKNLAVRITQDRVLYSPSLEFLFGTDELGRDLFARVIYGLRFSLLFSFIINTIAALSGIIIGGLVGYYSNKYYSISIKIINFITAIPFLLIIVYLSTISKSSLVIYLFVTFFVSLGYLRYTAIFVRKEKNKSYAMFNKLKGMPDFNIIINHIIPNIFYILIVKYMMVFISLLILNVTSSYLGLLFNNETIDLGNVLYSLTKFLTSNPLLIIYGYSIMFVFIFSLIKILGGIHYVKSE